MVLLKKLIQQEDPAPKFFKQAGYIRRETLGLTTKGASPRKNVLSLGIIP
jgi:hypothetical protein